MNCRHHSRIWLALLSGALLAGNAIARNVSRDLHELTGARTRVVWCQQVEGVNDATGRGAKYRLMGLDTDDRKGARAILDKVASYHRPMITPKGDRIVFTDFPSLDIYVVNWDGSGLRKLRDGIAGGLWMDAKGREWVYMVRRETERNQAFSLRRFRLDDPEDMEVMWDKTDVTWFNLQLSKDGTRVSGQFPHPRAGFATLPNGKFRELAEGCWTAMAPDNSYRVWVFEGNHRMVRVYDLKEGEAWTVDIGRAPGIDGYEVYHPRWSNHPRFMTMTGPYREGEKGRNLIGGGGRRVEVYVGRFSDGFHRIEQWVKVTENEKADFFPDVWIQPRKAGK
jgi:hypothetical protein